MCEFDINIDFHLTRVMRVEFIEHENCNGVCVSIIITFELKKYIFRIESEIMKSLNMSVILKAPAGNPKQIYFCHFSSSEKQYDLAFNIVKIRRSFFIVLNVLLLIYASTLKLSFLSQNLSAH